MDKETFRKIRLYLRKTQEEFAKDLGVSDSTIAAIETGRRAISDRVRMRLAVKFEITNDFIESMERAEKLTNIR